MTMLKKITTVGGLLAVSSLVAASAAFAHDGATNEPSHAYTNATDCTGKGAMFSSGSTTASETTDTGYPAAGYAADCGAAQGIDSTQLSATAHVLATCSIQDVTNETADVNPTNHPGELAGDPVTSFDFPTQVSIAGGKVNSDSLRVNVNCNSNWQLDATIDGDFTKVGDATKTKAAGTFAVTNKTGAEQGFSTGTTQAVGTYTSGDIDSGQFHFVSGASDGIDAGDYTGSFTLTVTALG
jgi:hypothetical protein